MQPYERLRTSHRELHEYWFVAFLFNGIRVWRLNANSRSEAEQRAGASVPKEVTRPYIFSMYNKSITEATHHARAWLMENGATSPEQQIDVFKQSLQRASHQEIQPL